MAGYTSLTKARTPSRNFVDERYQLNGLNLVTPDDLVNNGEAPMVLNCRMFARESGEKRVAIRTRKGAGFYTIPVGEALGPVQTSVTGAADQGFNQILRVANSFVATSTNLLSAVDVNLKTNTGIGTVLMEIRSDTAGVPGTLLAVSGTSGSNIVSTYGYVKFRFVNPAALTNGTKYWVVLYAQDDITNMFNVSSTTSASTAATSSNNGGSWSVQSYALNVKTYTCTAGGIKGWKRCYFSTGTKFTVFAHGTSLYSVNDATGVVTAIKTGLSSSATRYRFCKFNDKMVVVNGFDPAFTVDTSQVTATLAGVPYIPNNVLSHKNRLFFTQPDDPTRYFYSEPADETSYPSTNFGYVPAPKTSDPITAFTVFQDNIVFFTSETKYILSGSDLSSFTLRQAIGTKGAVSQEAIDNDRNYIYFKADDQIYAFNGATDSIISDNVQPEVDGFTQDNTNTSVKLYNNQVRIYYTASGQAVNSKMLLFNTIYRQWFQDTDSYTTMADVFAQDSGNPLVEASSVYGALFYAEADYSNLGAPIDFKYWTSYNKYLSSMSKDRIRKFHPEIRPSDSTFIMQVGKDVDFENSPYMVPLTVSPGGYLWGASGTVWGSFIWGSTEYQDTPVSLSGRGKHTQYRFERYGANTAVQLYGYAALLKSSQLK